MTATKPHAGVGVSAAPDAASAGREAAGAARARFGPEPPSVALLFTTSRLDAVALTLAVRETLGPDVPIFGANANGVIANDHVGYDGFETVVALLGGGDLRTEAFCHVGVADAERSAGEALGRLVAESDTARSGDPFSMFFLVDSVNRLHGKLVMNQVTPFLDGMSASLGAWPSACGARVMGDMRFNPTVQWCGGEPLQNAAVALLLSGVQADTAVLHGCRPTSAYHTITRSEGSAVLEIDGGPALEFVGDLLGPEIQQDAEKVRFFVTLGVNHGEKWAPFQEESYVNRMVVGVQPERGALLMNEPIPAGTEVQMMRRSFEMAYNRRKTNELVERVLDAGRRPFFALYVDCAGRGATYYGSDEEEADHVRAAIGDDIPLVGIYEAGEIASVNGRMDILDWSGVLTVFSY